MIHAVPRLVAMILGLTSPAPSIAIAPRELAPGVYALGSSQRFGGANVGWVVGEDRVVLIGAPDPDGRPGGRVGRGAGDPRPAREVPARAAPPGRPPRRPGAADRRRGGAGEDRAGVAGLDAL